MQFDLDKFINIIRVLAETAIPGSDRVIDVGEAVLDFVQDIRPTLAEDDQAKLDAGLGPLLAKMNRDVDQALRDLRGA